MEQEVWGMAGGSDPGERVGGGLCAGESRLLQKSPLHKGDQSTFILLPGQV